MRNVKILVAMRSGFAYFEHMKANSMNEPTTTEREKDTGCCGAAPCSAYRYEALCKVCWKQFELPCEDSEHVCSFCACDDTPNDQAFLRVVVETHDSRLEMDTRCGTASYIEARTIEAIRSGCVGILIASPNAPDQGPGRQPQS